MLKVNARYVDTPSITFVVVEVPLKKTYSEDAVNGRAYSAWLFRSRVCGPDYGKTFTESLILAQDERWRRA